MPEPIKWLAVYDDDSIVSQVGPDGEDRSYLSIDRSRLVRFALLRGPTLILSIHLEPEQRLIYRRRVFMRTDGSEPIVYHLAGWQRAIEGRNVQAITAVNESTCEVHLIGRWREDHPVFAPIVPVEGED